MIGAISMATSVLGMVGQDMPPEFRSFITSVTPILAKLGPVVGKMDFYQSFRVLFDLRRQGAGTSGEVQTYKEPQARITIVRSGGLLHRQGKG